MGWQKSKIKSPRPSRKVSTPVTTVFGHEIVPFNGKDGAYWLQPTGDIVGVEGPLSGVLFYHGLISEQLFGMNEFDAMEAGYIRISFDSRGPSVEFGNKPTPAQMKQLNMLEKQYGSFYWDWRFFDGQDMESGFSMQMLRRKMPSFTKS